MNTRFLIRNGFLVASFISSSLLTNALGFNKSLSLLFAVVSVGVSYMGMNRRPALKA
jgi:hypothetical protein